MANQNPNPPSSKPAGSMGPVLWILTGLLFIGLLFARALWPETLWITAVVALALIASLALLAQQNLQALRSRSVAYGVNSIVTVLLVIGIVGVIDFMADRYQGKLDLTKNKTHTLSDQSVKLMKGLQSPVKAIYFAKINQREQARPLLENYRSAAPAGKFEIEYVDPDKEPTRARTAGIKKYGTLELLVNGRDGKIEDVSEEKVTNQIIKLGKEKTTTLCVLSGHGEHSFSSTEKDGYDAVKKALAGQSYETKDVNLLKETKVPDACDGLAVVGPQKSFLEPEIKALKDYLDGGGRALFALDLDLAGGEYAPELMPLLASWYVRPLKGLVVDPTSRLLGVDASMPVIATFSKENPITKDLRGENNCLFPFARPLEAMAGTPAGLTVQWLAQSTPNSWAVMDLSQLKSKKGVSFDPSRDMKGPLNEAIAVNGKQKDSKATKNTRLVVFGTSAFAANQYANLGSNLDLFMNAVSWILEDESLISIRTKEDGPGKVELTSRQGNVIFLVTVILIPLMIAVAGVVIWVLRRRL